MTEIKSDVAVAQAHALEMQRDGSQIADTQQMQAGSLVLSTDDAMRAVYSDMMNVITFIGNVLSADSAKVTTIAEQLQDRDASLAGEISK